MAQERGGLFAIAFQEEEARHPQRPSTACHPLVNIVKRR